MSYVKVDGGGCWNKSESILKCKGIDTIFQKKGKIFENLCKNVLNLKIFWKRAGDCMRLLKTINC